MLETIIVAIFTFLVAVSPIPATIAALYFRHLEKEQGKDAWLLSMLKRGSYVKAISSIIISFFIVRGLITRFFNFDIFPVPTGVGTIAIGVSLIAVVLTAFYYATVIYRRRKAAAVLLESEANASKVESSG